MKIKMWILLLIGSLQLIQLSAQQTFGLIDDNKIYNSVTFLDDVQKSEKPVIILVATHWCPPCKLFKPLFQQVAQSMQDFCEFLIVDGDKNQEIVQQLQIRCYPTVICYKNGVRINPTNYRSKAGLLSLIETLLENN
ncbi:MAG: thioredoxin family protein [Candidatus Chromulinivorax sp.]